jgi:hypothetical protein
MPTPVNTQIEAAFQANPPWDQTTAGNEEYEEYEEEWEEESEEYAAYHQEAGHEAHAEDAQLVQPLSGAETTGEASKGGQHEGLGHYRDVSGDGCGDGGYCGGHWVKKSGHGHRRGEPIGEDPREEAEIGVCLGSWAFGPVSGVFTCATEAGAHLIPTR